MIHKLETSRINGYRHKINIAGILNFHEVRNWLSDTYGPCESLAHGDKIPNKHWTYEVVYSQYAVYLSSDEELSWFKVRWGNN